MPSFLTGPAGTVLAPARRLADAAAATRPLLDALADGSRTLDELLNLRRSTPGSRQLYDAANELLGARPALDRALGSRRTDSFLADLYVHADGVTDAYVKAGTAARYASASETGRARIGAPELARVRISGEVAVEAGRRHATALEHGIRTEWLPALERAAAGTAITRLAVGAIGLGTTMSAAALLRDDGRLAPAVATGAAGGAIAGAALGVPRFRNSSFGPVAAALGGAVFATATWGVATHLFRQRDASNTHAPKGTVR